MKHFLLALLILLITLSFSCKKASKDDSGIQTPLEFVSLNATDTNPAVNEYIDITAVAKGDELTYTWSSYQTGTEVPFGDFIELENGKVKWVVCHSAGFVVNCKVEDKHGNNVEKSVNIHVK